MNCRAMLALSLASLALLTAPAAGADKPAAPAHQVIACYFHRTVRCPTCQRIGGYVGEAVKGGFAAQVKDGRVTHMEIDFQDPRNEKYTEAYNITGPTLVLLNVKNGKVVDWKPAPKVWSLVGQKDAFTKYVQDEVQAYLDAK